MRLLLDTHVFLWWVETPRTLTPEAQAAIAAPDNVVFVSVVSAWEMAIKAGLGRLKPPDDVEAAVDRGGFMKLGIAFAHAARAGTLPRHHGDPFDRMLIAQAHCESLTLVTRDAALGIYGVAILLA